MNAYNFHDDMRFDCLRLDKLMRLWRNPGKTASPLFLALNIMDFTARLRRHHAYAQQNKVILPDGFDDVFERARQLITNDERIAQLVFDNISTETFHTSLKRFDEQYQAGRLHDDAVFDTAADLTDHYFSTELVWDCAEHFLTIPKSLSADVTRFRQAFAEAVKRNPDLAEAVRDRAETAPGGPLMPPWPELLEQAPDTVFDTVWYAAYKDKSLSEQKKPATNDYLFTMILPEKQRADDVSQIQYPLAADAFGMRLSKKEIHLQYTLPLDPVFEMKLVQYDDIVVLEMFGRDLDQLPEPLVMMDDTEITLKRCFEEDQSRLSWKIGHASDLDEKILAVSLPGTNQPVSLVRVTLNHAL
jgi:hypothetical protein